MSQPDVAAFVERMKRERAEQGLPEMIVDQQALNLIAALVARRRGVTPDERAA